MLGLMVILVGFIIALPLALQFLAFVLTFIHYLRAKRKVWPYVSEAEFEPENAPDTTNPYAAPVAGDLVGNTDYGLAMCEQAREHGFRPIARFYDGSSRKHKVRYDFHISPDCKTFAVVAAGGVGLVNVECTWMLTRLLNDRNIVTLDENKFADSDCSGRTEYVVLTNADFDELFQCHRKRVEAVRDRVIPYSSDDPITDFRRTGIEGLEKQVQRGWVKFLDPEHLTYKYTVKAAFLTALKGTSKKFFRAYRDQKRKRFRKPGHRGYVPSGQEGRAGGLWLERLRAVFLVVMFFGIFSSFVSSGMPASGRFVVHAMIPIIGLAGAVWTSILMQSRR